MIPKTLNIIYDTNYTNIFSEGGFVNHEFSVPPSKPWFFDLLFWDPNKLKGKEKSDQNSSNNQKTENHTTTENQQLNQPIWDKNQEVQTTQLNQTNQTAQENKANDKKTPWFRDLLFWSLNSSGKKDKSNDWENKTNWENKVGINNTNQTQTWDANLQNDWEKAWNDAWKAELTNDLINSSENWQNQQVSPLENVAAVLPQDATTPSESIDVDSITQNHDIAATESNSKETPKKKNWLDTVLDKVFGIDDQSQSKTKSNEKKKSSSEKEEVKEEKKLTEQERKANELREQIRKILEIPDDGLLLEPNKLYQVSISSNRSLAYTFSAASS